MVDVPLMPLPCTESCVETGWIVRFSQTSARLSVESYQSVPFEEQLPPIDSLDVTFTTSRESNDWLPALAPPPVPICTVPVAATPNVRSRLPYTDCAVCE